MFDLNWRNPAKTEIFRRKKYGRNPPFTGQLLSLFLKNIFKIFEKWKKKKTTKNKQKQIEKISWQAL